jgi:hypothetical protein
MEFSLVLVLVLVYVIDIAETNELHGADPFFRSRQSLSYAIKFPIFNGTQRFITVLTRALHWSPSRDG